MRTNMFFKVQVEHDADEMPERLAAEIARQIEKIYIVRYAELSSFTTVEN